MLPRPGEDQILTEESPLIANEKGNFVPAGAREPEDEEMIFMSCTANIVAAGLASLTLVANFVNISPLAARVGTTSEEIGSIFLGVAISAILGCLAWPTTASIFTEAITINACLMVLFIGSIGLSFCYSVNLLYFWYILTGFFRGLMATGAFAMIAYVHKGRKTAGPWFTLRAIVLATSGFVAVLFASVNIGLTQFYLALSAVSLFVIAFNIRYQKYAKEDQGRLPETRKDGNLGVQLYSRPYYLIVILSCISLGCIVGTTSSITSYLEDYIDDQGLDGGKWSDYWVLAYWTTIITGQLIAIFNQVRCSTALLLVLQGSFTVICIFLFSLVLILPTNSTFLWFAVLTFGILQGICEGFCFDIANRIIRPTPISATITLLILNLSVDGIPYLVTVFWDVANLGSSALFYVIVFACVMGLSIQVAAWLHRNVD